ncbi:MAG: Gfo/Idh/MocA family oxidoreductase, partial [Candidatus Acidiferrum sp.]
SGALGVFHATTAAYPGYPRRVEISGTEGTVILEHDRIVAADLRSSSAPIESTLARPFESAKDENQSASSATVSDFRGHQALLEDFLAAIRQNRAPACDGLEGRRSIALIESIYQAAKTPDRVASV